MTEVTRGSCWHQNFVPWSCLPLTCGCIVSNDDPGLKLTIFMTVSNLFQMLLYGWQLIEHWVLLYFPVCSNSAYPQHSGERYRINGPLVRQNWPHGYYFNVDWLYLLPNSIGCYGSHYFRVTDVWIMSNFPRDRRLLQRSFSPVSFSFSFFV